jgi:hypothetical protein
MWASLSALITVAKTFNPIKATRKILELESENAQLKRDKLALEEDLRAAQSKLKERAEMSLTPQGYYLLDDIAYCATCYETKALRVTLKPPELLGSGVRRLCPSCGRTYWDTRPSQVPHRSPWGGPNSWMGR